MWRRVLGYRQPLERRIATRAYSATCCKCDVDEGCGDDCLCRAVKMECVDCPTGRRVCDNQQIRRFLRDESKPAQYIIHMANNSKIGFGMFVKQAVKQTGLVIVFRGPWKPRSKKSKATVSIFLFNDVDADSQSCTGNSGNIERSERIRAYQ